MKALFVAFLLMVSGLSALAQTKPVYSFDLNKPYKYFIESKNNVVQEYEGQTGTSNIESNVSIILTMTKKNEDGSYEGSISVENAFIVVESDQGTQNLGNDLAGKVFPVMVKPDGNVDITDTTIDLGESGGMVVGATNNLFPRLNSEKMKVGESWTKDRTDTMKTERRTIIATGGSQYDVKGKKTVKGFDCLEIMMDGKVDIKGNVASQGQDLHVEGNQTRKATIHYDAEKMLLVGSEMNESGEQIITSMSNTSMRVNIASTGTTKIELITE